MVCFDFFFFSLQMQLDEVLYELEANDFGDMVRKCVYH
jgi:hypothetical protein